MTAQGYTDPQAVEDLRRLTDARNTILNTLPPNGVAMTDSQIAATTGQPKAAVVAHLHHLRGQGLVGGNGIWWHKKRAVE